MKRILIIEDEILDFQLHCKMIRKAGFTGEIINYADGESALTFLQGLLNDLDNWPEYIFIDLGLSYMDGFDLIEKLNNFPHCCIDRSKILILTSSSDFKDINESKKYRFIKKYIEKPLTVDLVYKTFSL